MLSVVTARVSAVAACFMMAMLLAYSASADATSEAQWVAPEFIHFRGETLFEVRTPIGTLAPRARAQAIESRIVRVADSAVEDSTGRNARAVRVDDTGVVSNLFVGSTLIVSVTDGDAHPVGRTRQQLADEYAQHLRRALQCDAYETSAAGTMLAVSRAIRLQRAELVSSAQVLQILLSTLDVVFGVAALALMLGYVSMVFGYFPSTRAFEGVSIFVGLVLSLGSTSAMANLVAGVGITYMRPFRIGDRVTIADTTGDVIEKTLLVVRFAHDQT